MMVAHKAPPRKTAGPTPTARERVEAIGLPALAEADRSFGDKGDVWEALTWVAFAAKNGLPVPPNIATWLDRGIAAFLVTTSKRPSLESALGFRAVGKANPHAAAKARVQVNHALARMALLYELGATIDQSATMVASLDAGLKRSTLVRLFTGSRIAQAAYEARETVHLHWLPAEVRAVLSEYPDRIGAVNAAKAAILESHSKRPGFA